MKYTDRLGLKKPDQDDAYQVDDFNENYQKISEAFAGVYTRFFEQLYAWWIENHTITGNKFIKHKR